MLVSCCVRSGMISSHYNRGFATVRSERRKRKERREMAAAHAARRLEVGLFPVCAVCLC